MCFSNLFCVLLNKFVFSKNEVFKALDNSTNLSFCSSKTLKSASTDSLIAKFDWMSYLTTLKSLLSSAILSSDNEESDILKSLLCSFDKDISVLNLVFEHFLILIRLSLLLNHN
ncbi:hypothetical protein NWE58_03450 [Mycoplasmopsis felis]|nr:hypothetical protein [Mycoplasmopsis felis]UWV84461.1 hypothetical protein NWE58_03450 [Mycoplasmopsis felis]